MLMIMDTKWCYVQVSDEVHNSTTDLLINVIDDNDNGPVFDQTLYQVSTSVLRYLSLVRMSIRLILT